MSSFYENTMKRIRRDIDNNYVAHENIKKVAESYTFNNYDPSLVRNQSISKPINAVNAVNDEQEKKEKKKKKKEPEHLLGPVVPPVDLLDIVDKVEPIEPQIPKIPEIPYSPPKTPASKKMEKKIREILDGFKNQKSNKSTLQYNAGRFLLGKDVVRVEGKFLLNTSNNKRLVIDEQSIRWLGAPKYTDLDSERLGQIVEFLDIPPSGRLSEKLEQMFEEHQELNPRREKVGGFGLQIFRNTGEVAKKLNMAVASLNAGNDSKELKNFVSDAADYLYNQGLLKKSQWKQLISIAV